jgi:hypothetical protein
MDITDPTSEAGFSVSFKLYDTYGIEKLITMRGASANDGESVLRAANELTARAIDRFGWSAHGTRAQAPQTAATGHAVPAKSGSNGHAQSGDERIMADSFRTV